MKEASKPNDTQSTILAVAQRLFLENGYRNTSMRRIAQEAKVNVGLLVYYFGTKNNLVLEIINGFFDEDAETAAVYGLFTDNPIENLFTYLLVNQATINRDPLKKKLIDELSSEELVYDEPSRVTQQLFHKVVQFIGASYSEEEIMIFSLLSKGVDRMLLRKKREGFIDIDDLTMIKLIAQTSILALGVEKSVIDQAFLSAVHRLEPEILTHLQ